MDITTVVDEATPSVQVDGHTWISFHLYYACDYRQIAVRLVKPLAVSLLSEDRIDSFFFIRYFDDVGPHVRLRLRLCGDVENVVDRVRSASARFFELEQNLGGPQDATVASSDREKPSPAVGRGLLLPSPFDPEIDRYGGSEAFPFSLDFFALSSAHALDYLERYGDRPRTRQRILTLCVLLWQACGFARDEAELARLLDYRLGWKTGMAPVIERADRLFEDGREEYCRLLGEQMRSVLEAAGPPAGPVALSSSLHLAWASTRLSQEIGHLAIEPRWSVGCSQLHMTGNRLGLSLAEESLAAEILCRTLAALTERDTSFREWIREALIRRHGAPRPSAGGLTDLLSPWLAALRHC